MKREHACEGCHKIYEDAKFGEKCGCGGYLRPTCERIDCHKPSCGKGIYGFGYIVTVCEQHYQDATQKDKDNAIRFRYAEG